jgi:hypothetical protein
MRSGSCRQQSTVRTTPIPIRHWTHTTRRVPQVRTSRPFALRRAVIRYEHSAVLSLCYPHTCASSPCFIDVHRSAGAASLLNTPPPPPLPTSNRSSCQSPLVLRAVDDASTPLAPPLSAIGALHPLTGSMAMNDSYHSHTGTLDSRRSGAATAAIEPAASSTARQMCCDCIPTQNRCSDDHCPCLAARKICDEHCESGKYRGDCLNQAICKCSCMVEEGSAKSARTACTKPERCDCLRIKEGCSRLCACKQVCKNKEPPKRVARVTKPMQGCTCCKNKKACLKKECPCRTVYEFCSAACKCTGE